MDATQEGEFGAPRTLFSDPQIRGQLNLELDELMDVARRLNVGWRNKVTYLDAVADQLEYDQPADFVGVELLELSSTGQDLSTTADSEQRVVLYTYKTENRAMELYRQGLGGNRTRNKSDLSWFIRAKQIVLVPPPSTQAAGTNAIRLTYKSSTQHMVNDGDEPPFPRPHHQLLCYRAAVSLGTSRGLDVSDLRFESATRQANFTRAMQALGNTYDDQMRVSGLGRHRRRLTRMGTVRRFSRTFNEGPLEG